MTAETPESRAVTRLALVARPHRALLWPRGQTAVALTARGIQALAAAAAKGADRG